MAQYAFPLAFEAPSTINMIIIMIMIMMLIVINIFTRWLKNY